MNNDELEWDLRAEIARLTQELEKTKYEFHKFRLEVRGIRNPEVIEQMIRDGEG